MKIDYVYPSIEIWHDTWSTGKGWILTMQRMGILNKAFPVNHNNYTEVFDYLNKTDSDFILVFGPSHFMHFMQNSLRQRDIWNRVKVPTVCICGESITNSIIPGYLKKVSNSLQCFDYFLCADERDIPLFKAARKKVSFLPGWVDGKEFTNKISVFERKNRLLFVGKINNFGIKGLYEARIKLLQQLLEANLVDYISEYIYTHESPDQLVDIYNNYTATINLPTNNGAYTQRVYEAMACGNLLFQYRLKQQPICSKIFEEYKHFIPYEIDDFSKLAEDICYYLNNLPELEKITIEAREEVLAKHTIEARLKQIIKFVESGQTIEQQLLPELENSLASQLELFQYNNITIPSLSATTAPVIVIDAVVFQLYNTGIARVWRSLLEEWAKDGFAKHIVVLDREGTAPEIPGLWYRFIPRYDYNNTDTDRAMLQQVCDEEGADLFISTYYTTPTTTPSVFMAYDMIPEILGADPNTPMWREKHNGIEHASAYIAISQNTAQDLVKIFPQISSKPVTVAPCGVKSSFAPAPLETVNSFKTKYGISKPYFLLVDTGGYKNTTLFFQAFAQLPTKQAFEILCTGTAGVLDPEFRTYTSGNVVHVLQLDDEELKAAYSGAVALIYPSKYEGFGLPVLEALACGCPVITCPNASIPEVAGEASLYVRDDDVNELANALCEVQKPAIRQALIAAGLEQAKKFSWSNMAQTVSAALVKATLLPLNLKEINLIIFPDWTQAEESLGIELQEVIRAIAHHPDQSRMTLLIDTSNIADDEDANLLLSSVAMNLLMEEDIDVTEKPEISLVGQLGEIQWSALLPRIQARIVLENENKGVIAAVKAENIPCCLTCCILPGM